MGSYGGDYPWAKVWGGLNPFGLAGTAYLARKCSPFLPTIAINGGGKLGEGLHILGQLVTKEQLVVYTVVCPLYLARDEWRKKYETLNDSLISILPTLNDRNKHWKTSSMLKKVDDVPYDLRVGNNNACQV